MSTSPNNSPNTIEGIVRSIQARTPGPHKTLLALRATLSTLIPLIAKEIFVAEAEALLRQTPPSRRESLLRNINKHARHRELADALRTLRDLTTESEKPRKKASTAGDHGRQS